MPSRSKFTAASDIGQHIDPAALEPKLPRQARIGRAHRDLKAAIGIEQGRCLAVEGQIFAPHDEIGNLGAVLGGDLKLFGDQTAGIEPRWCRLGLKGQARGRIGQPKGGGHQKAGGRNKELLIPITGRNHAQGRRGGKIEGLAGPALGAMTIAHDLADDIGGQGKDQTGLGRSNPIDRLASIGREDQAGLDRGGISDGFGQIETHQAALRKGLATSLGRPSLF